MSPFLSFVRASFVQQAIFVSLFWTTLSNIVHLGEIDFLTAKDFVLTPKRVFFYLKQFFGVTEQIPEVFSGLTIGFQNIKYISMHPPSFFWKQCMNDLCERCFQMHKLSGWQFVAMFRHRTK